MRKTDYILSLSGIRLKDEAKELMLSATVSKTAKKIRSKRTLKILTASLCAVLAAAALSAVFMIQRRAHTDEPTNTADDTTEASTGPLEEGPVSFSVKPLYSDVTEYDLFRDAVTVCSTSSNRFDVTDDKMPNVKDRIIYKSGDDRLKMYFGKGDDDILNVIRSLYAYAGDDNIGDSSSTSPFSALAVSPYDAAASLILSEYEMCRKKYKEFDQLIIGAAQYGTFEYLLTLPVGYDGSGDIYNVSGEVIGRSDESDPTRLNLFTDALASTRLYVYKIRFEYGKPVIYYEDHIRYSQLFSIELTDQRLKSADLYCDGMHIVFSNTSNDITDDFRYGQSTSANFPNVVCKPNDTEARCDAAAVVNATGAQWYLPLFSGKANNGNKYYIGLLLRNDNAELDENGMRVVKKPNKAGIAYTDEIGLSYLNCWYSPSTASVPHLSSYAFEKPLYYAEVANYGVVNCHEIEDGQLSEYMKYCKALTLADIGYAAENGYDASVPSFLEKTTSAPTYLPFSVAYMSFTAEKGLSSLSDSAYITIDPDKRLSLNGTAASASVSGFIQMNLRCLHVISQSDGGTDPATGLNVKRLNGYYSTMSPNVQLKDNHYLVADIYGVVFGIYIDGNVYVSNLDVNFNLNHMILSDGDDKIVFMGAENGKVGISDIMRTDQITDGVYGATVEIILKRFGIYDVVKDIRYDNGQIRVILLENSQFTDSAEPTYNNLHDRVQYNAVGMEAISGVAGTVITYADRDKLAELDDYIVIFSVNEGKITFLLSSGV